MWQYKALHETLGVVLVYGSNIANLHNYRAAELAQLFVIYSHLGAPSLAGQPLHHEEGSGVMRIRDLF